MTLNTSQSKDRGIGPTTSLSPTVRANSALDPSEGNLDSIASTSSRPRTRAVRLLPLRLAALAPAPALDAQKAPQQKCLALPRSHFCQMNRSQYLIRDIHIRVTMLLVAPLPNQRLDFDFHFEERTSATAHRSFRLRRMPRRVRHSQYSTKDSRSRSSSTSPSS
jgi:hypothetical protein